VVRGYFHNESKDHTTSASTGLTQELVDQSVVGEFVSGAEPNGDKHDRGDVDQKADEEAKADVASPSPAVDHHAFVDGDGVQRVG